MAVKQDECPERFYSRTVYGRRVTNRKQFIYTTGQVKHCCVSLVVECIQMLKRALHKMRCVHYPYSPASTRPVENFDL